MMFGRPNLGLRVSTSFVVTQNFCTYTTLYADVRHEHQLFQIEHLAL